MATGTQNKVTDPALLKELEADDGRVTDPSLLSQLEGKKPDLTPALSHVPMQGKTTPSDFKNMRPGHQPQPRFDESGVNETIVEAAKGMTAVPQALYHGTQQVIRGAKALPDLAGIVPALSPDMRVPLDARMAAVDRFERGAGGAADIALGGATVGMQAFPGMPLATTIAGVTTPLAGAAGEKVGGLVSPRGAEIGKRAGEFAGGVVGFGIGDLVRGIKPTVSLAIAFVATEGGAEGVKHYLDNSDVGKDMSPEAKERWVQAAGHAGFLTGLGLSHAVLGAARRMTSGEYADERARFNDAAILSENGIDPASLEKRALRRADAQVQTWKVEQEKKRVAEEEKKAANEEVRRKELFTKRILEQQAQEKAEAARQVEVEQIQARQEAKQKTLDKKFAPRSRMAGEDNKPRKPMLKTAAGDNPDYQQMREDLLAVGVPEHEVVRLTPLEVDKRWMEFAGETEPVVDYRAQAEEAGVGFNDVDKKNGKPLFTLKEPGLETTFTLNEGETVAQAKERASGTMKEGKAVRALAEKIARGEKNFTLEEMQLQKNNGEQIESTLKALKLMGEPAVDQTTRFGSRDKSGNIIESDQPSGKGYESDFSQLGTVPKPLGSYLGGKAGLLQRGHANGIVPQGLKGYDEFHEPFVGGGVWGNAFTAGNPDIKRHVNDLDPDVVNFHKTVKENPAAVSTELLRFEGEARDLQEANVGKSAAEVRKAANEWWNGKRSAHRWKPDATPEEKAAYEKTTPEQKAAWMAFQNSGNGVWGENQGLVNEKGEWQIKPGTIGRTIGQVNLHARGLRNTEITNEDARVALGRAEKAAKSGKKVFAAIDPPYLNTKGYRVGGDLSTDPKAAAAFIDNEVASAVKSGVDIVYTNAPEPEIIDALKRIPGVHTEIVSVASQTKGGTKSERSEVIAWTGTGRPTGIAGRERNPAGGVRQADTGGSADIPTGARPGKVDSGNGASEKVSGSGVRKQDVEPTAGTNPPGSTATSKPQTGRPEASPPSTPRGKYEHGLRTEFKLKEQDIADHMAMADAAAAAVERTSKGTITQEEWYRRNRIVGEADATPQKAVLNEESPAFRKWFGESVVTDKSGEPLVVYHGTPDSFDTFRDKPDKGVIADKNTFGIWFTDKPREAGTFATKRARVFGEGNPSIMPVYVSIKKPHIIDAKGEIYGEGKIGNLKVYDAIRRARLVGGNDGVIIKNVRNYPGSAPSTTYIAFKAEQVKSATGNRGTFDPKDKSILHQQDEVKPVWFSGLQRMVEQKMPERASAEQVRAIIRDAKKEEREELGIDDWLKDNPKTTKKQVLDFIEMNKVELHEVVKSEEDTKATEASRYERGRRVEEETDKRFQKLVNKRAEELLEDNPDHIPSFNAEARYDEKVKKWEAFVNDEVADAKYYKTEAEANAVAWDVAQKMEERAHDDFMTDVSNDLSSERDRLFRNVEEEFNEEYGDIDETTRPQYARPDLLTPGAKEDSNIEVLLTLPSKFRKKSGWTADQSRMEPAPANRMSWKVYDEKGEPIMNPSGGGYRWYGETEAAAIERAYRETGGIVGDDFTSGHFSEKNIVGHFRANEREIPVENLKESHPELAERLKAAGKTGARVMHVEELQSDWHQAGRKKGYNAGLVYEVYSKKDGTLSSDFLSREKADAEVQRLNNDPNGGGETFEVRERRGKNNFDGVPDAPFKKTWHEVLMKRVLRYAAENGYDLVTWTKGEQQVKRYSDALQHAVDEIRWEKTKDGVHLKGYKGGENLLGAQGQKRLAELEGILRDRYRMRLEDMPESSRGELEALWEMEGTRDKDGNRVGREVVNTHQREDELSDAIGKAMADKILADPNSSGTIKGKDITVSDTGMSGFYDSIVPSFVDKYTKKWGGKTGRTSLTPSKPDYSKHKVWEGNNGGYVISLSEEGDGATNVLYKTRRDAEAALKQLQRQGAIALPDGKDFPLDKHGELFDHFESGSGEHKKSIVGVRADGSKAKVATFDDAVKISNEAGIDIDFDMGRGEIAGALIQHWNEQLDAHNTMAGGLEVHSLEVTPDMRKAVLQGQSLFQGNGVKRGSIEFLKNGDRLIRAMKNPDLSTAHEEITHSQIGLWAEMAESGIEQAQKDLRVMERHTGLPTNSFEKLHRGFVDETLNAKQTKLYRDAQEKLVNLNRRYLQDGTAPTPELKGVFERFKQWLTDIYGQIRETVHPELQEVFDRMLGKDAGKVVLPEIGFKPEGGSEKIGGEFKPRPAARSTVAAGLKFALLDTRSQKVYYSDSPSHQELYRSVEGKVKHDDIETGYWTPDGRFLTQDEANSFISAFEGKAGNTTEAGKSRETARETPKTGIVDENSASIKNATTKAEREERGQDPIEVEGRRGFGEVWEAGKKAVDSGRLDVRKLALNMSNKPRPLKPEESAALAYDRMRLKNEHRRVMNEIEFADANGNEGARAEGRERLADIEEQISLNDAAAVRVGYEQGLGLGVRRMIVKEDYSLDTLIQRAKIANKGKELKAETRKKLEELSKQLEFAIQKYDGHETEIQKLGGRKAELFQELYRGGAESAMPRGKTALDVVNYERDELGNKDIVVKVSDKELSGIPSERLQWVTTDKKSAREYGKVSRDEYEGFQVVAHYPDTPNEILIDTGSNKLYQEAVDDPKRLAAFKNRQSKKAAKLLGDLTTLRGGNIPPKRQKPPPVRLDTEAIRLRDNVESLKKRVDIMIKQVEFQNMTPLQRAGRYLGQYRYINMLSSPLTHIVNTASNVGQAVGLAPATKLVTGGVDAIASRMTGKERLAYISDVPAYYRGLFNSLGEASTRFADVFKGRGSFDRPDVTYLPKATDEPNKLLKPLAQFNDTFDFFLNALEASDAFFSTLVRSGERESIANEYTKNGKEIDLKKIDDDATKRAKYWVFRKDLDPKNETGQGEALAYIDKMTNGVYGLRRVPGVSWIIPFVKTPANILKQGLEFSPAGVATLKGAENKPEQLAKAMVGSAVFAGAAWVAQTGGSTWSAPTGDKQKKEFYGSGKQPYSLKIGDKWVSYSRLGPLAYPVALAAAIKYYTEQNPKADDKTIDKIANVLSGQAKFFSDQSYMQGLGDLVKAASGDQKMIQSLTEGTGGQLVPLKSLQSWATKLIDPVYRNPETVGESFKTGTPFLSKDVPAYQNNGVDSERDMPFLNAFSPVQMRTDKTGTPPYKKETSGRNALIRNSPVVPRPPKPVLPVVR